MLERSAVKVARSVLRGLGVGNDLRLLDEEGFKAVENVSLWPLCSLWQKITKTDTV